MVEGKECGVSALRKSQSIESLQVILLPGWLQTRYGKGHWRGCGRLELGAGVGAC